MKAPIFKSAVLIAVTALFFSCQKDVSDLSDSSGDSKAAAVKKEARSFDVKGKMATPTTLVPDIEGGWNGGLTPAWFPGSGEGNLSHFGKFYSAFNQYAYAIPGETRFSAGYTAPLTNDAYTEVSKYVTGVPRQTGIVWYDHQGNSLWLGGTFVYTPDPDHPLGIFVDGTFEVTGGTGKFASAGGHMDINGYSRILNPQEPGAVQEFDIKGIIEFEE